MLHVARGAMTRANLHLPVGQRLQCWSTAATVSEFIRGARQRAAHARRVDNVICRKPHYLAYLAAFQVSSIVFTGQGKVGSENGQPHVDYQLSQRADS